MEGLSRPLRLDRSFVTSCLLCKTGWCSHDPDTTTLAGLHSTGLGWFRFARRYSGSRGFFLLLGLLRCFSSPRSLLTPMYSVPVSMPSTWRVSPFGNPRIIACLAAPRGLSQPRNVLHRFLAPEHPPCTLSSLTTITQFLRVSAEANQPARRARSPAPGESTHNERTGRPDQLRTKLSKSGHNEIYARDREMLARSQTPATPLKCQRA